MARETHWAAFIGAALISSTVTGQSLQVSPQQAQIAPQLQTDQTSGDGQALTMAVRQAQSDSSVVNANLTQVDPNASVVFEVPVEINTDGTFGDQYDDALARNYDGDGDPPSWDGEPLTRFAVECNAGSHQRQDGGWSHPGGYKIIQLDENGDFSGTVKIGVPLPGDDVTVFPEDSNDAGQKRDWTCFIAPIKGGPGQGRMVGTGIVEGGAYNERDSGVME